MIYCAFSRNHLMEGFSTFQWGVCFSDEGASILSGRCTSWGPAVLMGGVSKKIIGRGGGGGGGGGGGRRYLRNAKNILDG